MTKETFAAECRENDIRWNDMVEIGIWAPRTFLGITIGYGVKYFTGDVLQMLDMISDDTGYDDIIIKEFERINKDIEDFNLKEDEVVRYLMETAGCKYVTKSEIKY